MSLDKSSDPTVKSKMNRIQPITDIDPLSGNTEFRFVKADEYIMGVMEQTQINLRKCNAFKHTNKVNSVTFSLDGKYAASGSDDKTIKVWNLRENKNEFTLKSYGANPLNDQESTLSCVMSIAFSPNGKILIGGLKDGNIVVWNFIDDFKVRLNGHSDSVNTVAFSPDGNTFASGSSDGNIKLWNLKGC